MNTPASYEVNLTNCDKEPIHLLGKIQTHGYLMAFCKKTELLTHFSENCQPFLSQYPTDPANIQLDILFSPSLVRFCRQFQDSTYRTRIFDESVQILLNGQSREYKCHISNADKNIILEFEEFSEPSSAGHHTGISWLNNAMESLNQIDSIKDLAAQASSNFRKFSGFDRVMVYRFDENGDGEVIGEDKHFGLESFLGLRYPASDIPAQARKLYETNLVRAIHDIDDPGIHIHPTSTNSGTLDQSYSVYRSVSPIHIQYLRNMGVRATHANSIMVNNRLWGMLICHHYREPKHLGLTERLFSLLYNQGIAKWIEASEIKSRRLRTEKENDLLETFKINPHDLDLFNLLQSNWNKLSDLLKIDAFSILIGNSSKVQYPENAPLPSEKTIFDEYNKQKHGSVFILNHLRKPESKSEMASLAGFQILPPVGPTVYFFRKEKTKVFNWAGNPHKATETSPENELLALSPRKSFELWQELVRGTSLPWTDDDIQFLDKISDILRIPFVAQKARPKTSGMRKSKASLLKPDSTAETNSLLNHENQQLKKENLLLLEQLELIKAQLTNLQIELKDSQKLTLAKSDLVGNLSHEMRTPLNGILGFAQILQPNESFDVREYANLIMESGMRMLNTIDNLLSYAKLEHNAIRQHSETFTLDAMIHSITESFKQHSAEKNQNLQSIIHNRGEAVLADRYLIEQILINLISNAIKYTPPGGNIQVQSKFLIESGRYFLNLIVEDDGIGIPEDLHNKIFDPFFTVEALNEKKDNSPGLGLYLIKSYVSFMGGTVEIVSSPGAGSSFTVTIPVDLKHP